MPQGSASLTTRTQAMYVRTGWSTTANTPLEVSTPTCNLGTPGEQLVQRLQDDLAAALAISATRENPATARTARSQGAMYRKRSTLQPCGRPAFRHHQPRDHSAAKDSVTVVH
jgi:hypothetical protein